MPGQPRTSALVVFLSDYGLQDPFVGLCHAVFAALAPEARVVDLTHAVAPQAVRQGALLLADSLPWLPAHAVLLAVVDPGVGGARRGVVVEAGGGRLLVGPDNGLLVPAALAAGGVAGVWQLDGPSGDAVTFDGRDVFAPAAARLAAGAPPSALGRALPVDALVPLDLPAPEVADGMLRAEVAHVDRYGNVQLLARAEALARAGLAAGASVEVRAGAARLDATVARTFSDVPPGHAAVMPDAFGRVQVAVNLGSAAQRLGVGLATPVVVEVRASAPGGAPGADA